MPHHTHGLGHPLHSMALILSLAVTLVSKPSRSTRFHPQDRTPSSTQTIDYQKDPTDNTSSRREFEPMVRSRRSSVHYHRLGYGRGHDTRAGISVLGASTTKVCFDHDMGLHGLLLRHHLPMVPLGLFTGIFCTREKRFHWRSQPLWSDQHSWCPKSWLTIDSGTAL